MISRIYSHFLPVVLFFALLSASFGQDAPRNLSLFTSQCKAGEGICNTQEIVRYDFKDGEFVSKETVFSTPTDDFRFDFGAQVYRNRYIVSRSGGIFDIQTKRLLGDDRGFLIDIIDDDLLYEVTRVDLEGIFAFNLQTETYRKLPDENVFKLAGELSPDKKRFIVVPSWLEKKLQFHELENWKSKRKTIVKGKFTASCSMRCSDFAWKTPFVWIDNERILTQISNGDIVEVNINGKVKRIVKIKIDEEPDSIPHFRVIRDSQSSYFYYYVDGTRYTIDIKNNTFRKDRIDLGSDFVSVDGDYFWSEYFYKGKSIGRIWSSSPLSYRGFLVIDYAKEGKNLGYPDGIKIWNDIKNNWTTIDVDWGVKIVGWKENK